mgnify:CR=1 FL=1
MWRRKEFEVSENPAEGDDVQYAVLHILQLHKLSIPIEAVKFFMREPKEE